MKGLPVLMYHALEDESHPAGARNAGEQLYVLQASQFRSQMEYLIREGFRTFLLEELLTSDDRPEKGVVLTFDDGHESNYTLALPILQEYGFKAEFFITTGWIGTPYYLNPEQIKALHTAGMSVGSHGVTHEYLDGMTENQVKKELQDSMETLAAIIESPVISFSAPGGRMYPIIAGVADQSGLLAVCTSQPAFYCQGSSPYDIPRFSITMNITEDRFGSIMKRDSTYLRTLKMRNGLLYLFKKCVGNKRYEKVRGFFLDSIN